eukprot:3418121-Rhodomonas_salina.1
MQAVVPPPFSPCFPSLLSIVSPLFSLSPSLSPSPLSSFSFFPLAVFSRVFSPLSADNGGELLSPLLSPLPAAAQGGSVLRTGWSGSRGEWVTWGGAGGTHVEAVSFPFMLKRCLFHSSRPPSHVRARALSRERLHRTGSARPCTPGHVRLSRVPTLWSRGRTGPRPRPPRA